MTGPGHHPAAFGSPWNPSNLIRTRPPTPFFIRNYALASLAEVEEGELHRRPTCMILEKLDASCPICYGPRAVGCYDEIRSECGRRVSPPTSLFPWIFLPYAFPSYLLFFCFTSDAVHWDLGNRDTLR